METFAFLKEDLNLYTYLNSYTILNPKNSRVIYP